MKKLVIGSLFTMIAATASAVDLGVSSVYDFGTDRNGYMVTAGHNIGRLGLELGAARFTESGQDQTRVSLVGSLELFKVGQIGVSAKVGGAYLDNQTAADGYAAMAGVGVSMPITKSIHVVGDVVRQFGQERVNGFDGTVATAGLKYRF